MENGQEKVMVYYCQCGKSIERASHPNLLKTSRETKKDFKQAGDWGRKVEEITLEQFHKIPFMCTGVVDCIIKKD